MSAARVQAEGQGVVVVPTTEVRAVEVAFSIGEGYFEPTDAAVDPETTLVSINRVQEQHAVTDDEGRFDSGVLNSGDSFVTTVEGSATPTYHCTLHQEMTGSSPLARVISPPPKRHPSPRRRSSKTQHRRDTSGGQWYS